MLQKAFKKRFVRYFGVKLVGTVVVVLFTLFNSILTARLLGPEGKGIYTLLYSTMNLSVATVALKLGLSQVYYRKNYTLNQITSNSILLSLLSGLVTTAFAAFGILMARESVFGGVDQQLFIIVLCTIPFLLFSANLRTMLNADYDIPRATLVQISRPLFFFFVFGALALANLATLESAIYCIMVSMIAMTGYAFFMICRRGFNRFELNIPLIWPMLSFSLKTHIGQMFKFLQYRFDIFLVAFFLTPADVGIYSIAMALSEILWRIPNAANTVLLPRLSGEGSRRSAELTARVNRIIFAFTIVCLVPFAMSVDWIILIMYGQEYAAAGPAVLALLPGVVALSIFKMVVPNLIMRGRAWTFSFSVMCSVAVMVLCDLYLIPAYGIIGAGVAASLGYITAMLVALTTVVRINELPLKDYFNVGAEISLYLKTRRAD